MVPGCHLRSGGCVSGANGTIPKSIPPVLEEEVANLTELPTQVVRLLYSRFRRLAPNGFLTYPRFKISMGMLALLDDTFVCERLFRAFDFLNDGVLDFLEWGCALGIMIRGTEDERLELSFRIFRKPQDIPEIEAKRTSTSMVGPLWAHSEADGGEGWKERYHVLYGAAAGQSSFMGDFGSVYDTCTRRRSRRYIDRESRIDGQGLGGSRKWVSCLLSTNEPQLNVLSLDEFVHVVTSLEMTQMQLCGNATLPRWPTEIIEAVFRSVSSSCDSNGAPVLTVNDFKNAARISPDFLTLLGFNTRASLHASDPFAVVPALIPFRPDAIAGQTAVWPSRKGSSFSLNGYRPPTTTPSFSIIHMLVLREYLVQLRQVIQAALNPQFERPDEDDMSLLGRQSATSGSFAAYPRRDLSIDDIRSSLRPRRKQLVFESTHQAAAPRKRWRLRNLGPPYPSDLHRVAAIIGTTNLTKQEHVSSNDDSTSSCFNWSTQFYGGGSSSRSGQRRTLLIDVDFLEDQTPESANAPPGSNSVTSRIHLEDDDLSSQLKSSVLNDLWLSRAGSDLEEEVLFGEEQRPCSPTEGAVIELDAIDSARSFFGTNRKTKSMTSRLCAASMSSHQSGPGPPVQSQSVDHSYEARGPVTEQLPVTSASEITHPNQPSILNVIDHLIGWLNHIIHSITDVQMKRATPTKEDLRSDLFVPGGRRDVDEETARLLGLPGDITSILLPRRRQRMFINPANFKGTPRIATDEREASVRKRASSKTRNAVRRRRIETKLLESGPRGLVVHFGHESWNMVLNIMVGIRLAATRSAMEPARRIDSYDFMITEEFSIIPRSSSVAKVRLSSYDYSTVRFIDYAPIVFRKLREACGLDGTSYLRSVGPEQLISNMMLGNLSSLSELCSEGKSGALFYYTADGRFLVKTINRRAARFFRSMLAAYYDHVMNNPGTLITRIYGFHAVRLKRNNTSEKLYFVVMANVFHTPFLLHRRYDLKGSWVNRQAESASTFDPSVALKDLDLLRLNDQMRLGPVIKTKLMDVLRSDARFLASQDVIDYSLLFGIHVRNLKPVDLPRHLGAHNVPENLLEDAMPQTVGGPQAEYPWLDHNGVLSSDSKCIYFLGIIDIFTKWGSRKWMEHSMKAIVHDSKGVSCVGPSLYSERFTGFIDEQSK